MGFFSKSTNAESIPAHVKPTFKLCIPETIASSDTLLSSMSKTGNVLTGGIHLTSLIWLAQWKDKKDDSRHGNSTPSKVDKLLISMLSDELDQEIYIIADLFFEKNQETGESTYIAKALGSYSSIPKMLSANFKHKGELVAETSYPKGSTKNGLLVEVIPQSQTYEKRANFLFFWCEKRTIL